MRLAYMPDTHFGGYDQQIPGHREVAEAMEHLLIEAETAERVGFDGVWLPERHARTETFCPSTVILATAIAARTSRVHIASTVIQPTYHHPVHLAEQLALIDQLSKGRLIFGAGVGYHADYFRLFGAPMKRRGARFEEAIRVIEGVWTQDNFSFQGQFYEYDNIMLTPKPYQRPRPPIWVGAFYDKAIARALDWDGWVWWFPPELERAAQKINYWREQAYKRGKKNWRVALAYEGWVGEDEAELRKLHGHRWVRELSFYEQHGMTSNAEEHPVERLERQFLILGPPQKWIDRLGEVQERLQPDFVCIRTRNPRPSSGHYPSKAEFLECLTRLGEEVIRYFQKGAVR
ncbi:MAG TPA: LLM class flavin-dependent oxidoreductase [Methylomirabilota bacterium]|nr:LLM class flavin-dependent oxidoreductase [Methylomirabilota bacterium]